MESKYTKLNLYIRPVERNTILSGIRITDISTEGKGIGRHENLVVFVDHAVPGDLVDIRLHKKKSSFAEGTVEKFHEYSSDRTEPACRHFGTCGGCKWQNLEYRTQLSFKQKYVEDAVHRLAKLRPEIPPIVPSPDVYRYRNKLEFTFSNRKWLTKDELGRILRKETDPVPGSQEGLGFHIPKLFDKILDIETCHLQDELSDRIRLEVKQYAIRNRLSFHDIRKKDGFLRNLIVRNNLKKEWMVVMVFFYEDKPKRESLLRHLQEKFPQIVSLHYVINPKLNDSIADLAAETWSGQGFLEESMEDLVFRIGPKSFFQTNTRQATSLYKITREYADLKGEELVYDLYTGTGTIANFLARRTRKVVGLEYVKEAIDDATVNSSVNGITNTVFLAGDMKDILTTDLMQREGRPDVIITDPPRAGMHESVVARIREASPHTIVYVSCNPATQARDLSLLAEKYEVIRVQPVDMFPHTAHVESVAKLVRK